MWDWNGTLLDDVEVNRGVLNAMLERRGLEPVGLARYRELFRMPIVEMYRDLGFSFRKESFEQAAQEYFGLYTSSFALTRLAPGAREALDAVEKSGAAQYIVSAMREGELLEQVEEKGISRYFRKIVGLDDVNAVSKKERAVGFAANLPEERNILFVGDMDHDYEVSRAIGARCLIYSGGHQKIKAEGDYVLIDDLRRAVDYLPPPSESL
jgi:phosphoglycolate phosphatase